MKNLILIGLIIILIIFTGGCAGPSNGSETPEEPVESNEYEYCPEGHHGTSTKGTCSVDSDCVTDGCNEEICRSNSDESMVSICVYDPPYPRDFGCSCSCVENKCAWVK